MDERARKFELIPFLMGSLAVYKTVRLLAQVGWQSSTSRVSELMLSIVVGIVGFVIALCLLFFASALLLNYGIEILFSVTTPDGGDSRQNFGIFMISPTLSRVIIAVVAGLIAGILVMPAHRVARSFWLGTDQLQWNIPMANWGVIARFLLHVNVAFPLLASIIWIKPMASLFVTSEASKQSGLERQGRNAEEKVVQFWGKFLFPAPSADWAQDFGVPRNVFGKVQFWSLLLAGLLHLSLFRVHVQTYLNEALIVWYEGLHRSKVMNLELVRAKLLLNSYFLCRAAMQFFVPGVLVALLLGMSRIWGSVPLFDLAEMSPNLFFLRVVVLFMAWWTTFSWGLLTCVTLALYRAGFLLAS
ncbi:hypothetical protein GOP47_0029464 [Adiantum capillus-veneris]|nr:hypothetical protein GOP47_0029464 [Adiantum capillus-veneris]